jgi:drug/metabolite transporter (DMT)-like permease
MGSLSTANEITALTETADRQSQWSSTADVLKRRVVIARWVTFAFSILGALLAAIASQLNDPPRMYFALAGAVLLAVVSFVTKRCGKICFGCEALGRTAKPAGSATRSMDTSVPCSIL